MREAARLARRRSSHETTSAAIRTQRAQAPAHNITHASARFGYMDQPNVPAVLLQLENAQTERVIDASQASNFLSTIDLYRGDARERRRNGRAGHRCFARRHLRASSDPGAPATAGVNSA